MGYHRAGFDVVGVDIDPQPNYPFDFVQDDAIRFGTKYIREFDACHASPPCQAFTSLSTGTWKGWFTHHEDFIPATRALLATVPEIPTVIENVAGAPVEHDLMLCGEMFGLKVIRHRFFELNVPVEQPYHPPHAGTVKWKHKLEKTTAPIYFPVYGASYGSVAEWQDAMGIDWTNCATIEETKHEMAEAIPPAYTEYIGSKIIKYAEELVG